MPPSRRLRAAAYVLYGLAAAGTAALAQETSNTIGPPQLKDFTLPGQRTTPPATPAPAPPRSAPPAAAAPLESRAPAVSRERPEPRSSASAPRRDSPAAAAAAPAPSAQSTAPAATQAPAGQTAPEPLPLPPAAGPAAAAETPGSGWLWPAVGGAILVLLAAFLLQRRRRAQVQREEARDAARGELGEALDAGPRPAPAPAPTPEPKATARPRPWLELDIVPERAAATDAEAVVHYALTLTNQGDAEARNIRIDPRLFNAGAEGDVAAFLQGPIHDESGSPQVVIAPGGTLKLNGQVAMPMADVREIEMAGRRIFVPMVAINVAYDWAGGGTGRTSRSWLVGREAETPQAKMGPFRLDLGPRIYRSVGRREAKLVRV